MRTRLVSYDKLEGLLGQRDGEEQSTNQNQLQAAKRVLRAALLRELTDRQRECVRCYYYEGLTQEQTARQLGISKPTVCRHLQKARKRLREILEYAGAGNGNFSKRR